MLFFFRIKCPVPCRARTPVLIIFRHISILCRLLCGKRDKPPFGAYACSGKSEDVTGCI